MPERIIWASPDSRQTVCMRVVSSSEHICLLWSTVRLYRDHYRSVLRLLVLRSCLSRQILLLEIALPGAILPWRPHDVVAPNWRLDMKIRMTTQSVSSAGGQQVGSASAESYHGVFGLQVVGWRTNSCFPPDNYKSQVFRMRHHLENFLIFLCSYLLTIGFRTSFQRSALWTLPERSRTPSQSPNWLKQNTGWKQVHPKWPL